MKHPLITLSLLLAALSLVLGCTQTAPITALCNTNQPSDNMTERPITLVTATDLHYLAPSLYDDGEAFQRYVESGDGKLLHYSNELLDTWINQLLDQPPDAVVISGDLTNNGEKESHFFLARKLQKLTDSGIRVFVIPGNHDLQNPWALSFQQERRTRTEHITPKEFASIYASFGYEAARFTDKSSLSYVAEINDRLWLLMLDTNSYKNNLDLRRPQTDGQLNEETLTWLTQIGKQARQQGIRLVAVQHHNLLNHSDLLSHGFTLNNNQEVLTALQKAQVELVLSGHVHIQDIRKQQGIYDVATSSLAVYPHQYGVVEYRPNLPEFIYRTEQLHLPNIKEKQITLREYSLDFFKKNSYDQAYAALEHITKKEDRQAMAEVVAALNPPYFAGSVELMKEAIKAHSQGIQLWTEANESFMRSYVLSMKKIAISEQNNNYLQFTPSCETH